MSDTNTATLLTEKAVFQCSDCKSIFRFDAKQFAYDSYVKVESDDVIFKSNQRTIPPLIRVVSNIPFCPYCQGKLIILQNRLLDRYHEHLAFHKHKGTVPLPSLSVFLDFVLDVFESVQRTGGC